MLTNASRAALGHIRRTHCLPDEEQLSLNSGLFAGPINCLAPDRGGLRIIGALSCILALCWAGGPVLAQANPAGQPAAQPAAPAAQPAQPAAPGQNPQPGAPAVPLPGGALQPGGGAGLPAPQGPIPARDPRLPPPPTQETSVPPAVTTPAPAQPLPEAVNHPLTADEAARIALRLQPNIVIARASLHLQQGRTTQIKAGLNPQVGVSASAEYVVPLSGPPGSRSETAFALSPVLRQLIFDFNHTRDLVRQSVLLERAASSNITAVQSNTIFDVKQAFYQYREAARLVTVNEEEVTNRQTQLNLALARYNTGIGLLSDLTTAQSAKAEAIDDLVVARQTAQEARINLAVLMGIDANTPIIPAATDEPLPASTDVNGLTSLALRQRPEILQAQATIRSGQYGVSAARTTNTPVISGTLETDSVGSQIFPQTNQAILGIGLVWTPVDGGTTRGLVQQARATVESAQAQLTSSQLSVRQDVSNAYVSLLSAEQEVPISQADVANSEEAVRIATGRYATGIGQFADIINAEALLLTARINLVTAQENVQIQRSAVQRAIGAAIPAGF